MNDHGLLNMIGRIGLLTALIVITCRWGEPANAQEFYPATENRMDGSHLSINYLQDVVSDKRDPTQWRARAVVRLVVGFARIGMNTEQIGAILGEDVLAHCRLERVTPRMNTPLRPTGAHVRCRLIAFPENQDGSGWVIQMALSNPGFPKKPVIKYNSHLADFEKFLTGKHPSKDIKLLEFAVEEVVKEASFARLGEHFTEKGVKMYIVPHGTR